MGILTDHLELVRTTLLAKANEVGVARHGTVVGSARELVVSEFLGRSLPRSFDFVGGEMTDHVGNRSGQIDVMVLPFAAPQLRLADGISLGLVDAVAAVVEVKSTLTTAPFDTASELKSALETTRKVRSLTMSALEPWPWSALASYGRVRLPHVPVAIVAFNGPTSETLAEKLSEWARLHGEESLPNIVTCLSRDYTLVRNDSWMFDPKKLPESSRSSQYLKSDGPGAAMFDLFDYLMKCLQAWDYARPRTPLASYA